MDVRTSQTASRTIPGGHHRSSMRTVATLVVLLLAVMASLVTTPAARAAPVAASVTAARHGKPGAPTLVGVYGDAHEVGIAYKAPKSDGGHRIGRYEATFNGGKTWKKIGHEENDYDELNGYRST
jgi:hypothetical protein